MSFTTSEQHRNITVQTPEITIEFSMDDGGLRSLRRAGGPNLLGYGEPQPSVDVQLGVAGEWLAKRMFVRYLRHTVEERDGAVELVIVIGVGPLIVYDRYRITGTLIARRASIVNVGEDELQLHAVRLSLPWVRVGPPELCRFEAPGNNVRPHVPLQVAAALRASVLPRRFFAPGLREGRALEAAPTQGPGLLALYDSESDETLLCWYYGQVEAALPLVEGNDTAVTLTHQIELADWLRSEVALTGGTQYILLLREPWKAALAAFQRTWPICGLHQLEQPVRWLRDSAIYEVHPAQFGGFLGLAAAIPELRALGVNTLCLMPIWEFARRKNRLWDGNWEVSGDPYAVRDLEALDYTLGQRADLCALVATAHEHGMHILLDLPLRGCAEDARYVDEHPDWFSYDKAGEIVHAPGQAAIVRFDWANRSLQDYMLAWALDWLRSCALDGYRAIAPRARIPNWARRLPYHTGASSIGVVRFIDRLRAALSEAAPGAALIGELGGPLWQTNLDLTLDELPHHMFMHMAMSRVTPAELGDWLSDHHGALPPGALRACFIESHQTRLMNPLADGMRGSRISRMLLTGMVVCGFVPMIWSGQEQGDERFVGRLLRMWEQQPALRHGASHYNAVPCDSAQVFTVLRTWEGERLLGLLNVGPHRQTITVSLPVDTLGLPEGDYALYNLLDTREWDEEGQRSWRRDELLSLRLTLEPFGAYCFALRPVTHALLPADHDAPGDVAPEPVAEDLDSANGVEALAQAVAQDHPPADDAPRPRRSRRRREVAD
jgi:starch synthase (maltosyl-transferring)